VIFTHVIMTNEYHQRC